MTKTVKRKKPGPKKRRESSYPRRERLGIMFLSLNKGIPWAAEKYDVPENTIYQWFRQEGGLKEIRTFVDSQLHNSLSRTATAVFQELRKRLAAAPIEELFQTLRKFAEIEGAAGLVKYETQEKAEAASGASQILFQVVTSPKRLPEGKDGKDDIVDAEVIEVGDDAEDAFED